MPERLEDRIRSVRARIADAAQRSGRTASDVRLVAVTKDTRRERIIDALELGITDLGVNRAQQLRDAMSNLPVPARLHYLGRVQSNKVRYLDAAQVVLIHGLSRLEEAEALQRRAERRGREFEVLVECNIAGEGRKQGVPAHDLGELLGELASLSLVRANGLMIVAPQAEKPEDVRWVFRRARELRDEHAAGLGLRELSMGMTDDFEIAIEEGATIVRIGRAIFQEI